MEVSYSPVNARQGRPLRLSIPQHGTNAPWQTQALSSVAPRASGASRGRRGTAREPLYLNSLFTDSAVSRDLKNIV